ncbi:putative glycolipid-binding domain-containing protein [Pedobacter psychrodurus]|nr:putative glycolipid-binding domain-containing protein [Pedobacter psychrodurus]
MKGRFLWRKKMAVGWLTIQLIIDLMVCLDIDISLTPFTNTLSIRRLVFNGHLRNRIEVVYIDIIAATIVPAMQYYSRISESV